MSFSGSANMGGQIPQKDEFPVVLLVDESGSLSLLHCDLTAILLIRGTS